jgi:hypothetical protein
MGERKDDDRSGRLLGKRHDDDGDPGRQSPRERRHDRERDAADGRDRRLLGKRHEDDDD